MGGLQRAAGFCCAVNDALGDATAARVQQSPVAACGGYPARLDAAGRTGAYGISMLCRIRALHFFSLNRVYPLLSLSYAGVVGGRQPAGVSGGSQLAQSGRCGDDCCWSALHRD